MLRTLEDGTILRVNRTFSSWIDVPAAKLLGRRFQDLLTVGGRIFHHTHWAPLLRMQGSISEVKLEIVSGESVLPIVLNAVRRDADGTLVHDIAAYVARDRDRYEKELMLSRRRLEDLVTELNVLHSAAKDRAVFAEQMVGIVSHDLRNPLSAIQMGTELLGGSELSEPQQNIVGRVARATERATHLIEDLLDFTKARVGSGIAINLSPINLHECVAEVLDELRLAHPTRTFVHEHHADGDCRADPGRIAQLVGNLVSNAIAYGTPTSAIVLTTSVNALCSITVHNLGAPIRAEVQATMFEPMTRGDVPQGNVRSVGLGLFIVRAIAIAHGGDASVTSSLEAGTTFRVTWPRSGS